MNSAAVALQTLWTDAADAASRLDARYEEGALDRQERADLAHFIEHGWLIWRNAIPEELIDKLAADIRSHHRHPGKFLKTNHRNGQPGLILSGDTPDNFESLFDLYVNFPSARQVCLHQRIRRFLSLVFDARPVAFQQLLFQRSNGHRLHQDTSVVAVEEPLLLVASWIALEDVREGAGELAFYDRSHKIPHVLFKDGTKRMNPAHDDQTAYVRGLEQTCEQLGLRYQKFMAKKGDLLFWTADLVHRSHPRTLSDDTSRLSCVTHYCPDTTTPFWFRFHPDNRVLQPYGKDAVLASSHYRLPFGRRMLTPDVP